ncbi:glyceraldehyde 3-phosphate dehydrogenase NAD-binding domain-containing protein [Aquisalimonas lutea]|uniref:type I glyceraldehyde-3-phosphate dehydrogenase n=1 Tax=Aquisalimonas lutea TaxID=1327750 RepID=UPI0025B31BA5|nr:glyceraldehyde 3-phosphate dehydrogenase NAD-binding domain-containing protein [Aquisalimonas lutea]MDN3516088.1 glyceraldehyde 3-phosphate dehydrogenase NAD-binding domain-containing protein [Aquisalimonas lutea]
MPRLAINGYGRIGRCVLRALYERGLDADMPVVAINEPASLEGMAHLTRFDSTHGIFPGTVAAADGELRINEQPIAVTHASDPAALDWRKQRVDLVLDCSGRFSRRSEAEAHLTAGAPRVLMSHPMADASDVDLTVILGVNHEDLGAEQRLVSNASCSTNCLLPVLQQVHGRYGIEAASVTTIHSVMNDQPLVDGYHDADLRRTRSALTSMVPVATGLARGIERFMPEMSGRLHAQHVRVPTLNVSAMDVNVQLREPATADAVNRLLAAACERELAGILGYSEEAHASCDFNHDPRSGIVDGTQTRVSGRLAHLMLWFDNEWGFANRMVDVAARWLGRAA